MTFLISSSLIPIISIYFYTLVYLYCTYIIGTLLLRCIFIVDDNDVSEITSASTNLS